MRRLSALLLILPLGAYAQVQTVTLDEVLRIVSEGPRVHASLRDADAARAERDAAGAFPTPSLSIGRSRPAGGERTIFDANLQDQASLELPVPIFGQRGARVQVAERQVERAQWQGGGPPGGGGGRAGPQVVGGVCAPGGPPPPPP